MLGLGVARLVHLGIVAGGGFQGAQGGDAVAQALVRALKAMLAA
jgi:hypothetical protein